MMTKEASTKIVNFMNSMTGVLMQGCGHISLYNGYGLSSTLSMYSILIDIVLRIIKLLSNAIVDFYLFYDGLLIFSPSDKKTVKSL